jgi:hypothetical protein
MCFNVPGENVWPKMIMARWYMKTATVLSEFVGHDQRYAGGL